MDCVSYKPVKKVLAAEMKPGQRLITLNLGRTTAKFVKVIAENAGIIPSGKPGEGNPAWLLTDEILVE